MEKFIACVCDDALQVLTVSGSPSRRQLEAAFGKLYQEYCELTGSSSHSYQLVLLRKLLTLEAKQLAAYAAVRTEDQAMLAAIGYSEKTAEARLAKDRFTLAQLKDEYEKLRKSQTDQAPVTRQDFIRWIAVLSRYAGYRINPRTTYMDELVAVDKEYKASLKKT